MLKTCLSGCLIAKKKVLKTSLDKVKTCLSICLAFLSFYLYNLSREKPNYNGFTPVKHTPVSTRKMLTEGSKYAANQLLLTI